MDGSKKMVVVKVSNYLNDTTILLATSISYNKLNKLLSGFSEKKRNIAYQKHFGVGSVIKRRNTKKEIAYGSCKRALEFLVVLKDIKKNSHLYVVDR